MKLNRIFILLTTMLFMNGCITSTHVRQGNEPLPIIVLPDARDKATQKHYVMLKLPYGLIIHNGGYPEGAPLYCFFSRDQKLIMKTQDVDVLIAHLKDLPDGATIDMVSKCTVGFYSQYGVNIDEQYKLIMDMIQRKKFILVESLEDDERHASFCYCEGGFTILDQHESEQNTTADGNELAGE